MNSTKFNRASDSFYDRVEAKLKELGQSLGRSGGECQIVNEFAGLDFGVEPCATYIVEQRAKFATATELTPAK